MKITAGICGLGSSVGYASEFELKDLGFESRSGYGLFSVPSGVSESSNQS